MTLLYLVNIFFVNLIVSSILRLLLTTFVPSHLREPFNKISLSVRNGVRALMDDIYGAQTFEVKMISMVIVPFFAMLFVIKILVGVIPFLASYKGIQAFIMVVVVFFMVNSVPTDEEWDEMRNPDPASVLSIVTKVFLMVDYVQRPWVELKWFLMILIFPFSKLVSTGTSTGYHSPQATSKVI